eukprot:1157559-Pelagomonas_calceolata.AAC.5
MHPRQHRYPPPIALPILYTHIVRQVLDNLHNPPLLVAKGCAVAKKQVGGFEGWVMVAPGVAGDVKQ